MPVKDPNPIKQRLLEGYPTVEVETVPAGQGYKNVYQPPGITASPKFPYERAYYPNAEQASEAAANRAHDEYQAQWRTDPAKQRMLMILGLLGAR